MRSVIIISVFVLLVGLLFYSLFKQPVNKNTSEIRRELRTVEINRRVDSYTQRQLRKCKKDLFLEAHEYVDSLVRSLEVNPANEQDLDGRRYRPTVDAPLKTDIQSVPLEPLFEKVDSF